MVLPALDKSAPGVSAYLRITSRVIALFNQECVDIGRDQS